MIYASGEVNWGVVYFVNIEEFGNASLLIIIIIIASS